MTVVESQSEGSQMENADMIRGWLARIEKNGLGIIVDEDANEYPFTLDKMEGYRGQSLSDFDLKVGQSVRFALKKGKVVSVSHDRMNPKSLTLNFGMVGRKNGKVARIQ
ncbi:MAG: hypothetical protein ACYDAM_11930 [Leptospirales bacterium]